MTKSISQFLRKILGNLIYKIISGFKHGTILEKQLLVAAIFYIYEILKKRFTD